MSEINEFELVDYLTAARQRITQEFKEKPILDKYVQLIETEAAVLQECLRQLMQERSLDTAVGAQLDIIGDIVGQPRDLFDSVIIYYFGFSGATGALGFGDLTNSAIGGKLKGDLDPLRGVRLLSDDEYRALIKIKILKNSTRGVIDDFIQMTQLLYNVTEITYTETGATITINIGRSYNDPELSYFKGLDEIALAEKYLPIPLGISLAFDGTIL